jgi:hypothetical protein
MSGDSDNTLAALKTALKTHYSDPKLDGTAAKWAAAAGITRTSPLLRKGIFTGDLVDLTKSTLFNQDPTPPSR